MHFMFILRCVLFFVKSRKCKSSTLILCVIGVWGWILAIITMLIPSPPPKSRTATPPQCSPTAPWQEGLRYPCQTLQRRIAESGVRHISLNRLICCSLQVFFGLSILQGWEEGRGVYMVVMGRGKVNQNGEKRGRSRGGQKAGNVQLHWLGSSLGIKVDIFWGF